MASNYSSAATSAEFDKLVSSCDLCVTFFWASWSEPCKHMDLVVQQLAARHPEATFVKVEAEVVDDVTEKLGVTVVPCFKFLKGGKVVKTLEGADPPALTEQVEKFCQSPPAGLSPPALDPLDRIRQLLSNSPVVLFMKGDAQSPRCGFSGKVVEALQELRVPFVTVDILKDEAVRQKLKEYSNWPTYPQLYVKGELVGGCDIVMEMSQSGELKQLLGQQLGQGWQKAEVAEGPRSSTPAYTNGVNPSDDTVSRIRQLLESPVILFMKGTPEAPRCGFSRKVCDALSGAGIQYQHFDILQDEAVRQKLKEYSNWPTYPQLYVKGELVGGCDIVMEMAAEGTLKSEVDTMMGHT